MAEVKRSSRGLTKPAAGKLRVVTGTLRVRRGEEYGPSFQPVDRSVTSEQPAEPLCGQQPDGPTLQRHR